MDIDRDRLSPEALRRLEEFEQLEREGANREAELERWLERQANNPEVQRGVLARLAQQRDEAIRALADECEEETLEVLAELHRRLVDLDLRGPDDQPTIHVEPIPGTGEVFRGWQVGNRLYAFAGIAGSDAIIVKESRADGDWVAHLDEDGLPIRWQPWEGDPTNASFN